jgi:hypothetical protein
VPGKYLLELNYRDGRVESRPSRGSALLPLELGRQIEIEGTRWVILDVDAADGYRAKVTLDEE